MAHSLRAVSRLVAMTQRSLVSGVNSEARRNFGTTSLLKKSNYEAVEGKRGSLYHLLWKRKFTWLFVFGGLGFVIYESLHPDRANRTEKMRSEWAHMAGGAYDPTKPQKENKAAKDWLTKILHFRDVFMMFEMNEKSKRSYFFHFSRDSFLLISLSYVRCAFALLMWYFDYRDHRRVSDHHHGWMFPRYFCNAVLFLVEKGLTNHFIFLFFLFLIYFNLFQFLQFSSQCLPWYNVDVVIDVQNIIDLRDASLTHR